MTKTAGQALTAEIRRMYSMNAHTRWNRKGGLRVVTRDAIVRDIREAIGEYRGTESAERTAVLDAAFAALNAYGKFVENFRIDGVLRFQIMDMTPWQFSGFLGAMVDSGCANNGEFEQWFAAQARELCAAA